MRVKSHLFIYYNIFMKIKIKVDQTKLPNKMHFETQLRERMHIYKPKKGKGSYNRKDFKKL